jgi:hypothetical protein
MKILTSLRGRIVLVVLGLALLGTTLFTAGKMRVSAGPQPDGALDSRAHANADRPNLHERVRNGLGSEVRFATPNDSSAQVQESVESVAHFIFQRSGLSMSTETKKRLAQAENAALKGSNSRLSLDQLSDTFTEILANRVATLSDAEIEQAANIYTNRDGLISSRSSGKWGTLQRSDFISQVKAARDWSQRGDQVLRTAVRTLVSEEINDRATYLSAALPEQFGQISERGVTPLQAVLIGYSVVADDPMTDSRSEIARRIRQERIDTNMTLAEARAQGRTSNIPYGANGFFYASPVYLAFDRAAVETLLNSVEGGQK